MIEYAEAKYFILLDTHTQLMMYLSLCYSEMKRDRISYEDYHQAANEISRLSEQKGKWL